MYMMFQGPSQGRNILCCVEYLHTHPLDYQRLGIFSGKHFVFWFKFVTLFDIVSFVQLPFSTLLCYVYNNIASLVTKGYHGYKYCEPSIKARCPTTYESLCIIYQGYSSYKIIFIEKHHLLSMVNQIEPINLE